MIELPEDVRRSVETAVGKVIGHVLDEYDKHREEMAKLESLPTDELLDEMDRLESAVHFSDVREELGDRDPAIGREDQIFTAVDIRKLYGRKPI